MKNKILKLAQKYPPSKPCSCARCLSFCKRPGWWTVDEAVKAVDAGYGARMMLEIAPELTYGVLSPAFKGCEGGIALELFSKNVCNFLNNGLCELHGTGFMPLECRFCHHKRVGLGEKCHLDIEKDWISTQGQALVERWGNMVGLWKRFQSNG